MARTTKLEDISVEKKLSTLFQLQTTLSEIDKIKTIRGELPLEVQDLEDEVEGLNTRIAKFDDEINEQNMRMAGFKARAEEAEKLIARYKEQLNEVKNNREYDMLSKEIEFQTLEVAVQEKKLKEAQAAIVKRNEEKAQGEAQRDARLDDLELKKNELQDIVTETKAEEEKLREVAHELEAKIDARLLTSFKRIRRNSRNGLGIVYVQRDACGGCFNKIPPQRQLDVRTRKKIIVCEYCGRILIDPELAGVKIEKAKDEKPKRTRRTAKKKED